MIVVRMGPEEQALAGDPLGRTHVGYRPGLTESEVWERGRGVWKLKEGRTLEQELAVVVDPDWIVRAVATVTAVSKAGDRRAIEGELLAGHDMVGTPFPTPNRSRNAISYHPD
ncbi:hypothetical protein [Rhodococcus rhodnii]|uniref:hypothetical protein n=1 Tax=Rhodococcus rhodnii TaxID=38312 RepID=UPI0009343877|nr:hypothetical protein [Rhodococcus rhodnii]